MNDLDTIEYVLQVAEGVGYVRVDSWTYCSVGSEEIASVSEVEQAAVDQLLGNGWFELGKAEYSYRLGRRRCTGKRVLVPRRTRSKARRWRGLCPMPGHHRVTVTPSSGWSTGAGQQPSLFDEGA